MSAHLALQEGKYFPKPNDYDTEHDFYWYLNQDGSRKLPGMGGVFNAVNMDVYHYAGLNPVKLVDPDGELLAQIVEKIISILLDEMLSPTYSIVTTNEEKEMLNNERNYVKQSNIKDEAIMITIDNTINESIKKIDKEVKEEKIAEKYKQAVFRYPKGNVSSEGRQIAKKQYEIEKRNLKNVKNISQTKFASAALQFLYKVGLLLYNDYQYKNEIKRKNGK